MATLTIPKVAEMNSGSLARGSDVLANDQAIQTFLNAQNLDQANIAPGMTPTWTSKHIFSAGLRIAAAQKLFLATDEQTYVWESTDGKISIVCDNVTITESNGNGLYLARGAYLIDSGGYYRFDGSFSGDTHMRESAANVLSVTTGGVVSLMMTATDVKPGVDNTLDCGTGALRWNDVYATNATIQTSDRDDKTDITDSDLGLDFIKALRPVKYRWKNTTKKGAKAHVRPHYGLIAQEVYDALKKCKVEDFAGYINDSESKKLGLRYSEFIGPLIKAVQELSKKVDELTPKKKSSKKR